MDACHWNNTFCSGLWKHWRFICCDLYQMHVMGFISNSKWFCVKSFHFAAVRVCLFAYVCVWQAQAADILPGRQRWGIVQRWLIGRGGSPRTPQWQARSSRSRGVSDCLFTTASELKMGRNRFTLMCQSRMFCPLSPPRPPTQSHTFESSLLI